MRSGWHDADYRKEFSRQFDYAKSYLIPKLEPFMAVPLRESTVLEVGSNVGGLVCAYSEVSKEAIGIEVHAGRIEFATAYAKTHGFRAKFVHEDAETFRSNDLSVDVVIMNDVLEHLATPEGVIENVGSVLRENGLLYISFPPYFFPFAGHFAGKGIFLRYVPFAHVLIPRPLIIGILRNSRPRGEWTSEAMVEAFEDLNRMTIRRCKRLLGEYGFNIEREEHFLVPPMYRVRYGLSSWSTNVFRHVPFLCELVDNRFSVIARRGNRVGYSRPTKA